MKKLLNILTAIILSTTVGVSTSACSNGSSSTGQVIPIIIAELNKDCLPGVLISDNKDNLCAIVYNSVNENAEIYKVVNKNLELFASIKDGSSLKLAQQAVFDKDNNLYTYFIGGQSLYKIAPDGTQTTFNLTTPAIIHGIVCDKAGNIFISTHDDNNNQNKILKIPYDSTPSVVPSEYATLSNITTTLIIDNDNNIFCEAESGVSPNINTKIYKITPPTSGSSTGTVLTYCNMGINNRIYKMVLDSTGNLYTSSQDTTDINKIVPNADKSTGTSQLFINLHSQASNLVFDSKGNLYAGNSEDSKIYKTTTEKQETTYVDLVNDCPSILTIDSKNNLYAVNIKNNKIYRIGY